MVSVAAASSCCFCFVLFLQLFKNVKMTLSWWTDPKQAMVWIWPTGLTLPMPLWNHWKIKSLINHQTWDAAEDNYNHTFHFYCFIVYPVLSLDFVPFDPQNNAYSKCHYSYFREKKISWGVVTCPKLHRWWGGKPEMNASCDSSLLLFLLNSDWVRESTGRNKPRLRKMLRACLRAQSCLTLCDPMDCSPPGSSVHGVLQTTRLEWVAISYSRGSSHPGITPTSPALAGSFFTTEPPGTPKEAASSGLPRLSSGTPSLTVN